MFISKKNKKKFLYFFKSFVLKISKFFHCMFGIKYLDSQIGNIRAPFLSRFRIKTSFAQQGEDLILERILTKVLNINLMKKNTYVDIGANDAIHHSVTYNLYLRGWHGVIFDPLYTSKKSFEFWRKRDKFINAVVGKEHNIYVDFFVPKLPIFHKFWLGSTKYPTDEKKNFKTIKLRQVNLDIELKRIGIKKIHVLNLDVEGSELEILESFDFDYHKPSVIVIEIHGNSLTDCLKSKEAQLLFKKGYKIIGSAVITHFFVRQNEITK